MDWATLWKVLGTIGVTGALSTWFGGYLGDFLPPPPRVLRKIREIAGSWRGRRATAVDDGRYHLVLCGLDGDDAKEGTLRLLGQALNPEDYPMLRVTLSARCIRLISQMACPRGRDCRCGAG